MAVFGAVLPIIKPVCNCLLQSRHALGKPGGGSRDRVLPMDAEWHRPHRGLKYRWTPMNMRECWRTQKDGLRQSRSVGGAAGEFPLAPMSTDGRIDRNRVNPGQNVPISAAIATRGAVRVTQCDACRLIATPREGGAFDVTRYARFRLLELRRTFTPSRSRRSFKRLPLEPPRRPAPAAGAVGGEISCASVLLLLSCRAAFLAPGECPTGDARLPSSVRSWAAGAVVTSCGCPASDGCCPAPAPD